MEIKMALTTYQTTEQLQAAAIEATKAAALGLADLAEMQRTQPALYQAMIAYGAAMREGDSAAAFKNASDVAAHVLALAAGQHL